jgi:Fe-Mn family superoxide dismutase
MKPSGGGAMPAALEHRIVQDFGDVTKFKQQFSAAGAAQFGSGWVWLVENKSRLEVVTTSNADTPITEGKRALIGCDVWEHAYYVDYRNARADFLRTYLDHLVSWEEALQRLNGPEA